MKEIGLEYELLAEYALLKEGFIISPTIGDYASYDLICDWGGNLSRIQVRSSHYKQGRAYRLSCNKGIKKELLTKEGCDFIFAIAGNDNVIYIIPIEEIKSRYIRLHPDKKIYSEKNKGQRQSEKWKWEQYIDRYDLLR